MSEEASQRATEWLDRAYGGLVTLTDTQPLVENERTWLFGCGYSSESTGVMLASALAVPKEGGQPFPLANSAPFDEEFNLSRPGELGDEPWRWRVNARNCVVATDAAVSRRPASALPWQPRDEAPGWWDRLVASYFPGAEVAECPSWGDVASAIIEGGPGTRGVVWLRRQLDGVPVTGHLLYADYLDGQVAFLDGQRGGLATLEDSGFGDLVLARFTRPPAPEDDEEITVPWEIPAPDLSTAVAKATSWLEQAYEDEVVLVAPDASDETQRGWLFACTTKRFQESGDWREQMLDAALVVPKDGGAAPFGLPNPDPWAWFQQWDAGETELSAPPGPGPTAAWFAPLMRELGSVHSANEHEHWGGVFSELTRFPTNARAVVWLRRRDERGRESVGNLLLAEVRSSGVRLIDSMTEDGAPAMDQDALSLHVIRYE
jgi:hypothetical protein